jgi:peptidoglycan/xylan/chitin deacetylase (PgdA/CDA1 family)
MIKRLFALVVIVISVSTGAQQVPIEIHDRLIPQTGEALRAALTLDACSGKFDDDLIEFLIRNRIPATIFATKKWLDHSVVRISSS